MPRRSKHAQKKNRPRKTASWLYPSIATVVQLEAPLSRVGTANKNEFKPLDDKLFQTLERLNLLPNEAEGDTYSESSTWAATRDPGRGVNGERIETEACIICGDEHVSSSQAKAPCSHNYCGECINSLFQSATVDESLFPPRCCSIPIPVDDNIEFLSTKMHLGQFPPAISSAYHYRPQSSGANGTVTARYVSTRRLASGLPHVHVSGVDAWRLRRRHCHCRRLRQEPQRVIIVSFDRLEACSSSRHDRRRARAARVVTPRARRAAKLARARVHSLSRLDPVGFGTDSRSISRTLEYSYNDYCLATMAAGLEQPAGTQSKYMERSMDWRNLWKEDQTSLVRGKDTGFLQPRYTNGTWGYQDPIACSALASFCSLTTNPSETFEASIWQHLFFVPHAVNSLISLVGGDEAFISRLDFFHTNGLADISNEPVFLIVYLYHYAGRPSLSAKRAHTYIPLRFNDTPGGLPGNDDSGAMGAFFFFSTLGLFPIAGQNVYLISPPFFPEVNITSPLTGKTATIRSVGFDPSYMNLSIQRATVNGTWTKSWIGHEFFTEGWTLELVLGEKDSDWGTKPGDRPPSWTW
ncbi:hypothetical protein HIM_09996 [Hirsutella minnesotensis 3608]|uniref:RING-type domain-containing protein n=1 Tax=Hirsutella minnesotensis 3608 TaxID=1043627 RepID=A0A0F7ZS22_9HYPO|nr:hypothetical protein HIM_09996 [Hirsutella minnesotensis 3608]